MKYGRIRLLLCALIGALFFAATNISVVNAQQVTPQEIPAAYGFPAKEGVLEGYVNDLDVRKIRNHGWMLWAGVNSQMANRQPIWTSWINPSRTFNPILPGAFGAETVNGSISFEPPRQFDDIDTQLGFRTPTELRLSPISSVLFNIHTHDHIRNNELYKRSILTKLNEGLPSGPVTERMMTEFPRNSVALKLVWWPVASDGLSRMPVWDFEPANPVTTQDPQPRNPINTWKRSVVISSVNTYADGDTIPSDHPNHSIRDHKVVTVGKFYTRLLQGREATSINNIDRFDDLLEYSIGRKLRAGDRLALIAMHITTKEIPDWVWATYWWHDNPTGSVYADHRPDVIRGVWRNYVMDVGLDFYNPREFDGSPDVVYNPYLEARFANGLASNCMSCHGRAVFPEPQEREGSCCRVISRGENDPLYDGVFSNGVDPAYEGNRMRLDFLWSMHRAN